MIGTLNLLLETPRGASMDVLSDVLRAVRLSGAVFFRCEFSAPWSVMAPDSHVLAPLVMPRAERLLLFHVVAEGEFWVQLENQEPVSLRQGDVVVFPHGSAHVMGTVPSRTPTSVTTLLPRRPGPAPLTVVHGGGGAKVRLVCGFLHCDETLFNPLLSSLPALLCVRARSGPAATWLETTLHYMVHEASSDEPGNAAVLARLTELLFVEILRRYLEDLPPEHTGWLAGLKDPFVGRALGYLHGNPGHGWTVQELSRRVGLSRSVLADRFTELLGQPPMHYLASWRLQVAGQLLRQSDDTIAGIAAAVGYDSEAAFHRAFKRHLGLPPATWRRQARAS